MEGAAPAALGADNLYNVHGDPALRGAERLADNLVAAAALATGEASDIGVFGGHAINLQGAGDK